MTLTEPGKILLGPDGRPISSRSDFNPRNTKAPAPITGTAFGDWAGRDVTLAQLPGGGVVQFDLSKLTVEDFRMMRDHYQVNASLSVLSFMQHQSNFHVVCDDPKIAEFGNQQLHDNWTQLNRAMSMANWAGYAPNVLEWENNLQTNKVDLTKIKDLVPEECRVNWKLEEGWAPPGRVKPKFKKFDGIRQFPGQGWPIPVNNSFWYPMLMENGDYYGRKLLRPAFQAWYFSMLMHLFANRYYERFGEPTPIGRAPFDDVIKDGTKDVNGSTWMLNILQQLRNRSVVVLPNDRTQFSPTHFEYDYNIEYLESQMRGADFERYMTRLDEEISIGLFTPILMLRTADVGSYNLGTQHKGTYSMMLDALNDDRAFYIDRYILSPLTDYNFSPNAPRPHIVFKKMGNQSDEILRDVIVQLIKNKQVKPDITELGEALGMSLKEIKETVAPPAPPAADPTAPPAADPNTPPSNRVPVLIKRDLVKSTKIVDQIKERVAGQVKNAHLRGLLSPGFVVNMGFRNRLSLALEEDGLHSSNADVIFARMDAWWADVLGVPGWTDEELITMFDIVIDKELDRLR